MTSDRPNFLSQPVVKNLFMYRNGDPYFEARRVVINQKRVCNFETLLREVTAGIQPSFGAVRNIYTPRGGHKVDRLDSMQSGEQYVAAGRERFKKLDYLQIGSRKKRMLQTLPMPSKPLPQSKIIVSARFLKPIREPCTIFIAANGNLLDPAVRLLIHQKTLYQFERILEMITEKMGLRVLGGVRSLYTCEGHQVTDGSQLENGQLYVAVGRDKFKKLPYGDLLFPKPRGARRVKGMKASSLPPIYRFPKQSGNGKPVVRSSESGDRGSKASPLIHNSNSKEQLSSIVREISQARLLSLRKRKSGQSLNHGTPENDDLESKADDRNQESSTTQDQPDKQQLDADEGNSTEEMGEKTKDKEDSASEKSGKEDTNTNQETNGEQEGDAKAANEEKVEGVKEEKEEVKSEDQGSNNNSDKSQDGEDDGSHTFSEGEKDQNETLDEEKQDKNSGIDEKSSKNLSNDSGTGEKPKESDNCSDLGKPQSDNEAKETKNDESSSSNDDHEENSGKVKEDVAKDSQEEETKVNGEVCGGDGNEVESEAELNTEEPKPARIGKDVEDNKKHTETN
ncbi:doublecortin domain-containing protein 2-like [Gouania willdenowi]|uniref:Doublecortin domain-containing protein 2 n=1 Tax=Gouania willdenowi TaxID=441366 RepID=A0A8C5G8I5_GOUWI|nr:doublecortin domain-containing protein 2-like [Gouania willdenowi]